MFPAFQRWLHWIILPELDFNLNPVAPPEALKLSFNVFYEYKFKLIEKLHQRQSLFIYLGLILSIYVSFVFVSSRNQWAHNAQYFEPLKQNAGHTEF